jgi:transcriptional regulator with XRE-family HTH domain
MFAIVLLVALLKATLIIAGEMKNSPKAKITDENREESRLLKALWDSTGHAKLTQAEFGHQFGIGTQAAVGFFLNGKSAISLKAARGFARGLNCPISSFSKRLAAELADAVAPHHLPQARASDGVWPFSTVTVAQYYEVLTQTQRDILEATAHSFVNAREPPIKHPTPGDKKATPRAA